VNAKSFIRLFCFGNARRPAARHIERVLDLFAAHGPAAALLRSRDSFAKAPRGCGARPPPTRATHGHSYCWTPHAGRSLAQGTASRRL